MNQAAYKKLALLRRELHQYPDLSGQEGETAKKIRSFFESLKPDEIIPKIGGEGIAFLYYGREEGPTTLIRCELDGLPILEENHIPYKSSIAGKSHTCGHDGHMAIVSGIGMALAEKRPKKGKIILLFQPAEETGEGARKVLGSPAFAAVKPDYAFALHNLPGFAKHEIIIKQGPFTAASRGMEIDLKGRTSHAAFPEAGNSPAEAMSRIIPGLQNLPESLNGFALVTVVNAVLGEIAFGTTPGQATIRATLRTFDDSIMEKLVLASEELVSRIANEYQLGLSFNYKECFQTTENHPDAWAFVNAAANQLNLKIHHKTEPFRWSEDFGQFSTGTKTMLFGIGNGLEHPQLHESCFDFPDEIIPTGVEMFLATLQQIND